MLALLLHNHNRPPLRVGEALLPISSWQEARVPLQILRRERRRSGSTPAHYLTLVKLPDDHPVALIVGDVRYKKSELRYYPLAALPSEDREILAESFARLTQESLSGVSLPWVARLVLGRSLGSAAVKWTKDLRLLEKGSRNAATKRT